MNKSSLRTVYILKKQYICTESAAEISWLKLQLSLIILYIFCDISQSYFVFLMIKIWVHFVLIFTVSDF